MSTLAVQFLLSLIIAATIYSFKPYLVENFFRNPLAGGILDIMLLVSLLTPFIFGFSNIFASSLKLMIFQLKDYINIIFVLVFSLIFFGSNFHSMAPPLSYLAAGILTLSVYYAIYRIKLRKFREKSVYDMKISKDVFNYAFAVSIGSFASIILPYTDVMVLTYMKGVESVAYYNVVLPSLQIVLLFTTPVINILWPIVTNLYHNNKKEELSALVSFVYNNFLIFTLPIASIFFIYSREVINFIFGEKYIQASGALKIYLLFWIFIFLRRVNFSFLGSIGEPAYVSKTMWIGAIGNLVLDIILIKYFDYTGAVIATGFMFLVMALLTYNYLRRKIAIRIDLMQQVKIITSTFIFMSIAFFLEQNLTMPFGRWGIVIEGFTVLGISGIFYVVSLAVLKVITMQKINYVKNMMLVKQ